MKTLTKLSALALAALVASASLASAKPVPAPTVSCSTSNLSGSTDCEGPFSGNPSPDIPGATFFGKDDWVEINKAESGNGWEDGVVKITSGAGSTSGMFELAANAYTGFEHYMIAIKGGPSFSVYLMDGTTLSGDWNTDGIVKGNGQPGPGLSNFSLWGSPTVVPLPAGGWLLLTGLAGLGFARRRRAV